VQITGLDLARRFYDDAVAPIVTGVLGRDGEFAAALIGPGSEVLGFDSERSRDHDWGPRCQLFLTGAALEQRDVVEPRAHGRVGRRVRRVRHRLQRSRR